MLVRKFMTEEVVFLGPDDTVRDAVAKFADNRISGSPVMDETGRILGVLSEKDILKALKTRCKRLQMVYPSLSMVSVSFVECFDDKEALEAFTEIAEMKVEEIMSHSPVTIEADRELGAAINLMNEKHINRIPVTEGGIMVGIITRKDVIKGLAHNSE